MAGIALLDTERSAERLVVITGWYHVCYCWSVITMASFMLARDSARTAKQTLFYVQAIDQLLTVIQYATQKDFDTELLRIPSIQTTRRLPATVLFRIGM